MSPFSAPFGVLPRWTPPPHPPLLPSASGEKATRRRFCQAPRRVVLGDGAPGIWNIAEDQFPEAIQIVDRFHAKQHLSDLGKTLYVPTSGPVGGTPEGRTRHRKIPGSTQRYPARGIPF